MRKMIHRELMKCMGQFFQQQSGSHTTKNDANMIQDSAKRNTPFDGHYAFSVLPSMHETEQIVDSGASTRICANTELLYTTYKSESPTKIYLPNGFSKIMAFVEKVKLTKDIQLDEVLYVQGLSLNQAINAHVQHPEVYRKLVGHMSNLNLSRPDISHATQQLTQFIAHKTMVHCQAAIHVLKYLKGCPYLGVFYPSSLSFQLKEYSDTDWALVLIPENLLKGIVFFQAKASSHGNAKIQSIVSVSYIQSEYKVIASTAREFVWKHNLLEEFHITSPLHISLFRENHVIIQISQNVMFNERTIHLDIDCQVVSSV